MSPPNLFFVCRIILTVLTLLLFHMNFRSSLLVSGKKKKKKSARIFIGNFVLISFFFSFFFFLVMLHSMGDLSFLTRDQTCIPCSRSLVS